MTAYKLTRTAGRHYIFGFSLLAALLLPLSASATTTYTITDTNPGSNISGGIISPAGTTTVTQGANLTYSITPYCGEYIAAVFVDGTSVGAVSSYTFTNVTASHTISATFQIPMIPCSLIGPVLLAGPQAQYNTAQEAYDAIPIGGGDTIMLVSEDLGEFLTFDQDVNVTLKGGYPGCWWSCPTDPPVGPGPTIESSMTISNGTVIVDYIALR